MSKPTDKLWEIVPVFDNYKSLKYVKGGCRAVINQIPKNYNLVNFLISVIVQRNDCTNCILIHFEERYDDSLSVRVSLFAAPKIQIFQ